jgi:hypothetical protein
MSQATNGLKYPILQLGTPALAPPSWILLCCYRTLLAIYLGLPTLYQRPWYRAQHHS